jgi:DNA-binding MarR family transcriptional regulator
VEGTLKTNTHPITNRKTSLIKPVQKSGVAGTIHCAMIFGQAFNTFSKAMEKVLSPSNLTVSQFLVLRALLTPGSTMTQKQISRVVPIETQSVSSLLDRLQERKLVKRRRSQTDRRFINVVATAEGKRITEEVGTSIDKLVMDVFHSNLSKRERQNLLVISKKIRDMSIYLQKVNVREFEDAEKKISSI